jgi:cytochrome c-type biogenesis protein
MTFLVIAFLAGILSCASTCFLPLVPAYVSFMGGQAASAASASPMRQQVRVLTNALLFVGGFTTAFVALGAAAGLVGADLQQYKPVLGKVAGIALVLMGIALLGGLPWLMRERRLAVAHRLPRAPWAMYVVGLAFAIGWTPCISPVLTAILIKAADAGTAGQGAVLLGAYSLGLGVPFLVAAGLIGTFTRAVTRIRGALPAINGVAAVLMIGMGLLVFTNRLTILNSYFPYFAPPFQDALSARALGNEAPSLPASLVTPIKTGTLAPDFTLTNVEGQPVTLSSLHGKPVLITFWATWCVPCREELPVISAAYLANRDQGFTVIAVDFGQETPDTIRKFWTNLDLQPAPFPDPDGRVSTLYGVGLKTTGLPVSVFVGRDGRVRNYYPFPIDAEFLKERLRDIL